MSFTGLIANGANDQIPNILIINNGFFPDISSNQIREIVRLDGSITNSRLIHEIKIAMVECNRLLAELRNQTSTFIELNTDFIDNQGDKEILYFQAIASCTAAALQEKYRSYDSSGTGQNRADDVGLSAAEHKRNQRYAIRDLLGNSRMTVELL